MPFAANLTQAPHSQRYDSPMNRTLMVAAAALLLAGCGSPTGALSTSTTQATVAGYDGTAYARQVQAAVLDGFGVQSFAQACPQPDWVCAIGSIDSPRAGAIDVVLQADWQQALPEASWSGPPAGIGCAKWGEQISRNVVNFAVAAHLDRPDVTVYKHDGSFC
jgi:hypothetical protein